MEIGSRLPQASIEFLTGMDETLRQWNELEVAPFVNRSCSQKRELLYWNRSFNWSSDFLCYIFPFVNDNGFANRQKSIII